MAVAPPYIHDTTVPLSVSFHRSGPGSDSYAFSGRPFRILQLILWECGKVATDAYSRALVQLQNGQSVDLCFCYAPAGSDLSVHEEKVSPCMAFPAGSALYVHHYTAGGNENYSTVVFEYA